ncbi:pyruvate, phosphate dikinase [Xanthobacter autotrophicus]|uniref:PEP/pyruvate-binding domain-containing protein n=1 Tax=Xanthobacter TaxID=279 RepID=UPI0024AA5C9D|nr:PEP/pyruvate-binding domain-containing protein [Xanthobacter autotrophicus]MDI4665654.1 pyruvate, phosphate dikinase [Xanthobacter autotrophicus]
MTLFQAPPIPAADAPDDRLIGFIGAKDAGAPLSPRAFGSKAAQLWRMNALGLNVPPAFVLSTALCGRERKPGKMEHLIREGVQYLEQATGRGFGDRRRPLLVSVRSGAEKSMPGMLETVLDVGATPETVRGLMRFYGNPRLAWDCRRRFIEAWCEVVEGLPRAPFEAALKDLTAAEAVAEDRALDPEALERLAATYLDLARDRFGVVVPAEPERQLAAAVEAVFRSWDAPKAVEYRRLNHLEWLSGTAVTVQAMVFGNSGARSGSGVAFSRDPATGAKTLYADMLFEAQGEDVVSGRRQPTGLARLETLLPEVAAELKQGVATLEHAYGDVQDVEFTIEDGRLFFLQTRAAKRTPRAALKIAVDLVAEGARTEAEGLALLDGVDLSAVATSRFPDSAEPAARGVAASPGCVAGRVALDTDAARRFSQAGDPVILVRPDVATDDIAGLALAAGILTAVGGRTAHAAVVARQLGRVCIVGCGALAIDLESRAARLGTAGVAEGDWLSLDGDAGTVFLGRREVVLDRPEAELAAVARWREAVAGAAG